jgi:hypothetical protein
MGQPALREAERMARLPKASLAERLRTELKRWPASWRRRWVASRLTDSGLFDADYYQATYPFLAGRPDLSRHFVKRGAAQGLNPHLMFDTNWYLGQNPDVRQRGLNPLYHFLSEGAAQGRQPHPQFTAAQLLEAAAARAKRGATPKTPTPPERPVAHLAPSAAPLRFWVRPLGGAFPSLASPGPPRLRTILLSHVLPFPPRAGNEYRIHRLLRWLERTGHEVVLVVAPLPGSDPSPQEVAVVADAHPNLVICLHSGEIVFQLRDPALVTALEVMDGQRFGEAPVSKHGRAERLLPETADVERTFCPDHLLDLLHSLTEVSPPDVFVSSYVFTSRALLSLGPRVLRVIDTHDVFSTKQQKVLKFGIQDGLALSPEAETAMLRRADLVIAIQPDEAKELKALAPSVEVVTAGVDFDVAAPTAPPETPVILYVASNNAMNVRGIADFLALAWPVIRRERPDATLRIVGPVGETVTPGWDGVEVLGRVDQLAAAYAAARVVINPAVAGTGLKIKTLEALAHLRPIVVWPSGIDGLSPAAAERCHVARDWYEFTRLVLDVLATGGAERLFDARVEIEQELGADRVYAELNGAIERHWRANRTKDQQHG